MTARQTHLGRGRLGREGPAGGRGEGVGDQPIRGSLMTWMPSSSAGVVVPASLPAGVLDPPARAPRQLAGSGMRIGELCGLWFCDLHLRRDHPCGQRRGPHVHVVKRINPNGAAAKRGYPAAVVDGVVTGGIARAP
jgi:hypothetical protein